MRPVAKMACALALHLVVTGCAKDESDERAPAPETEPAPAAARPAAAAFRIALPPPTANGPRATLTVRLTGEHLAEVHGVDDVAVEGGESVPGRRKAFSLAAHATELQRLRIGGTEVLVRVPPGAEMSLGDQPCFGWELRVPWLDPAAHALRPTADGDCPRGATGQPADHRCPAGVAVNDRCCFPISTLSFAGAGDQLRAVYGPGGDAVELWDDGTLEVVAADCGFYEAETATDRVALAIGFGKRWQIEIDDQGRIAGRALPWEPR